MLVYHLVWSLSFFGHLPADVLLGPVGRWTARLIAGSFLVLVGVGLVLAHERGFDRPRFLRRLAILVVAAAAVTAVSLNTTPQTPILFGILHVIALASVVALPLRRAPIALLLALAAAAVAAPLVARSSIFDGPGWVWLGLAESVLPAADHTPLLPWIAPVLLGVVAIRTPALRRRLLAPAEAKLAPAEAGLAPLAWLGRWSLPIYLAHQPFYFALLSGLAFLAPQAADPLARFRAECAAACSAAGGAGAVCEDFCACSGDAIAAAGLTALLADPAPSAGTLDRLRDATAVCAPAR